ncbi:pilus assembly protein [Pseudomonas sp. R2.Fl]|nr:pilus assembly protein [Pseudomonas sp. R2.Fl]
MKRTDRLVTTERVCGWRGGVSRLTTILAKLRDDRQGLGAVEFALLFPMLLVAYLTAFELTLGMSVIKRATAASSTIADLLSRQTEVKKADLEGMVDIATAMFAPYGATGLDLKITGIAVDADKKATVRWSWENNDSVPYVVGSPVTLSDEFAQPDTFLIHSELSVPHELLMYLPNFSGSEIKNITIAREYYFRQRVGDEDGIACLDC